MSDSRFSMRLLLRRTFGFAGATAVAQVLMGLVFIIAARNLGPDRLGPYVSGIAVCVIASNVFDFGMTALLVRDLAAEATTMEVARRETWLKRPLLCVLVPLVVLSGWLIVGNFQNAVFLGVYCAAIWEVQVSAAFLRSGEKFAAVSLGMIAGRAVSLGAVSLALTVTDGGSALVLALLLGSLVEALMNNLRLGFVVPSFASTGDLIARQRESFAYGLTSLSASAQQLDTPLVALGGGATAAGLYGAAGRLLGPLIFLAGALSAVASPWLARAKFDELRLQKEERNVALFALVISAGPGAASLLGPFLLPLLLGESFRESGPVFSALAVGAVFGTLNQGLSVMVQNRGAQGSVARCVAFGLCIGLMFTYMLAHWGGASAAAWGFAISQLVILVLMVRLLAKLRAGSRVSLRAEAYG